MTEMGLAHIGVRAGASDCAMWFSKKSLCVALVVVAAVVGATFIWIPFPKKLAWVIELASTCCLVAIAVAPSVLLYVALNWFARFKRYRYLGFFLPVLCVLTYAVVVFVIGRIEQGKGNNEAKVGEEILDFLAVIYIIEVCIAAVFLRYFCLRTFATIFSGKRGTTSG